MMNNSHPESLPDLSNVARALRPDSAAWDSTPAAASPSQPQPVWPQSQPSASPPQLVLPQLQPQPQLPQPQQQQQDMLQQIQDLRRELAQANATARALLVRGGNIDDPESPVPYGVARVPQKTFAAAAQPDLNNIARQIREFQNEGKGAPPSVDNLGNIRLGGGGGFGQARIPQKTFAATPQPDRDGGEYKSLPAPEIGQNGIALPGFGNAQIPQKTFAAAAAPDLNFLAERIQGYQGREAPLLPNGAPSVDHQGNVAEFGAARIPQKTFASAALARYKRDMQEAQQCLPPNHRALTVDGFNGFAYTIRDAYGLPYTFFMYHDGQLYQVICVDPQIVPGAPTHAYKGGRLCLNSDTHGGFPLMKDTYAQSVIWAMGYTTWRATGSWPFSKK